MAQLPDGTLLGGIAHDTQDIVGGGGWVVRFPPGADDGTMVCGSDACGPRVRKPTDKKWRKLFKPGINAPMIDFAHSANQTWDVAICAEHSDNICFVVGSQLSKTTDGGATVTTTALTSIDLSYGNEPLRMTGQMLAYDPKNPNVILVGTPLGLKITSDGGDNFSDIASVPVPPSGYWLNFYNYAGAGSIVEGDTVTGATSGASGYVAYINEIPGSTYLTLINVTGTFQDTENLQVGGVTKAQGAQTQVFMGNPRYCIAFDRTSAVVGGKTQGIYVFVTRAGLSGLYHSTDGGANFSNVSGGPWTAAHMAVSPHDGSVHIAGHGLIGGITRLYKRWNGSTWHEPSDVYGKGVAVSPHNSGHIYLCTDGTGIMVSTNNGTDWSSNAVPTRRAVDIPWLEWCEESYMSNGNIAFDGAVNRLWNGSGIGTWYIDNPPTSIAFGATQEWIEATAGIENMVSQLLDVDDQGKVLYTCQDRRGFVFDRDTIGKTYPLQHALGPGASILHGGNMSEAPDDPNTIVMAVHITASGVSRDGGRNWAAIPLDVRTYSGGAGGGVIVALSANVWVQREINSGQIWWTKDGGVAHWEKLIVGSDQTYYGSYPYIQVCHEPLAADKYVANQAWLYLVGDGTGGAADLSYRGVWRINYNPISETMSVTRKTGPTSPYIIGYGQDYYHGRFQQIGVDDWLWCGGDAAVGLWRSTDGMATWNGLSGTDDVHVGVVGFGEVFCVGVGKPRASGPKTILACGYRQAVADTAPATFDDYGYWLSEDDGASWVRIAQLLNGVSTPASDVAGDLNVYGLFYAGHASEGLSRIKYQDKRAWS